MKKLLLILTFIMYLTVHNSFGQTTIKDSEQLVNVLATVLTKAGVQQQIESLQINNEDIAKLKKDIQQTFPGLSPERVDEASVSFLRKSENAMGYVQKEFEGGVNNIILINSETATSGTLQMVKIDAQFVTASGIRDFELGAVTINGALKLIHAEAKN